MKHIKKFESSIPTSTVQEGGKLFHGTKDWRKSKFANPKATINIGTTFSGIGAIEHAFQRLELNHDILFAGDIDEHVKRSYFANYEIGHKHWHADIHDFSAKKYKKKIDLLVGGSPCQAFSMVGKRLGLEDTRGTLFYEFARIVQEAKPKVFIYENVRGLTNHDGGRTWKVVKDVFHDLGYKIHFDLLNSKAYGRIRKLTPRECLRLMGFRDTFKIEVSDTQMYRQAGNSIVVDVLIALLKQMDITRFGNA